MLQPPKALPVLSSVIMFYLMVSLTGCSGQRATISTAEREARAKLPPWTAQSYPAGYRSWHRITPDPIPHPDENEVVVLYRNSIGESSSASGYERGTVLVKAQHRMVDGRKGPVYQLSVMRKKGGAKQAGWTFSVYDPVRYMQLKFDQDVCLVCHQQRAGNDFIFSRR